MDVHVDYSCEDNSETGRTKLTVSDFDTTSIRDVKYAIQDAIQAPVCDQQLFYQGQPVTDDDMPLSRLYFREGDCFKLQFLAVADIPLMRKRLDVLKNFAQEIVEKLNNQLPVITLKQGSELCGAIRGFTENSLTPWKCLTTVAQRHFFVQEEGFEAFLEVFKFSRRLYHDFEVNENSAEASSTYQFNQCQLYLHFCCLDFLWSFGETSQDRKYLMSKDVFSQMVDAILLQPLQPCPHDEDTGQITRTYQLIIDVNEAALGCLGGLVEYDSRIQEEVCKNPLLMDKLLFMIDRCQSKPAGYSLDSSEVASNILFYCTFNVKSAQPQVDCGALEKVMNITKRLLNDKDSHTPLRYYSCLFLARMRSSPLVKLDRDTCVAIDERIEMFLNKHVPSEISKWEEENFYVWITMRPFVHLAFAAGKKYYCDFNGLKCDGQEREGAQCILERKQSETTKVGLVETGEADMEELQKRFYPLSSLDNKEENVSDQTSFKGRRVKDQFATLDTLCTSEGMAITSDSGTENCVMAGKKDQFTWPGSTSTQKLGIFSLVHMLSIKENQQLALSEYLLPYLVCLSWHLNFDEKEKLRTSLANFHNATTPPSLKVAAKSVLALVNGLDMVFNL